MSVPLPAFRRVRLTQQCVIHPQDKGGNYLPCALEDWVLFVSLAAAECLSRAAVRTGTLSDAGLFRRG